tara:strand:- start:12126 stop:12260 length:135 start_codon:yes stop_codon:yes gene_type:complete
MLSANVDGPAFNSSARGNPVPALWQYEFEYRSGTNSNADADARM